SECLRQAEEISVEAKPKAHVTQFQQARRSAMESNKPAQNIQDSFLNTARKERTSITIYLLSGVKLTGRIRSFDKYSVVLEANARTGPAGTRVPGGHRRSLPPGSEECAHCASPGSTWSRLPSAIRRKLCPANQAGRQADHP